MSTKRIPYIVSAAGMLLSLVASGAIAQREMMASGDSVASTFARTERAVLPSDPSLDDYVRVAMLESPALRASFSRWQAAVAAAGHVGKLPDPTVSYGYFIDKVETRVGPQNQRLAVRQAFPWFGTLGAKRESSLEQSKSAWQGFQASKLELLYSVKSAYYNFYYLGREIALTRENLELLGFWESIARTRYSVALTQHPDVIRAQVELGKLEDRLQTLESMKIPAAAKLRAAVGVPPETGLPVPGEMNVEEYSIDRDRVMEAALAYNPDIKRLRHTVESARAGVRFAVRSSRPSFVVGVDYIETGPASAPGIEDSGKDPLMVSVGMSIPIWMGSNRARRKEAQANVRAAEYDYADAMNRLAEFVDQSVFEYTDALRKTRLYRDGLVPKAKQSLNASYTSYQASETDFLNVLDAQRQLLELQLMLERSRTDLAIRRAAIEMLTAGPLDREQE